MTIRRRKWKARSVVAIVGIASLALGVTVGLAASARAGASAVQARVAQTRDAGSTKIMNDPAAVEAMRSLHSDHIKDMEAWRSRFGSDPGTSAGRVALLRMQGEHRDQMRAALKKAGIKGASAACAAGMMGTGTGGMMGTAAAGMMGAAASGMMGAAASGMMGAAASGIMGADTAGMMGGSDAGARTNGSGTAGDIHQQHHSGSSSAAGGAGMMGGPTL